MLSKYTGLTFRAMGTNIKYKNGFYGDGILSKFPIEYSANYLHKYTKQGIKKTSCDKFTRRLLLGLWGLLVGF